MSTYEISVSNPWFDYIKNKKKKVEGRLNKNVFSLLKKGDIVIFTNNDEKIKTVIERITKYNSFNDYLTKEGLNTTLPNIKTIEDGIMIYREFYSEEKERQYGVLAIEIMYQNE